MAEATIRPGVAAGDVQAPPSKSLTHRAYLLAAQSDAPCAILRPLRAADPDATLACLHRLGASLEPGEAVRFTPAPPAPPRSPLDCRNAGTTLRLLAAYAARLPFPVTLDGDASLRGRSHAPLLEALAALGATIRHRDGRCPVTLHGPLRAGAARLPAGATSQAASGLLLSLPMLEGDSTLTLETPVASAPYLDVTRACARAFGLDWGEETAGSGAAAAADRAGPGARRTFHVPGGQVPRRAAYEVEGDWSAAAFPLAAAAITRGKATVRGLRRDSPQGDRAVVEHLLAFGAAVRSGQDHATVEGADLVSPGALDMRATPDLLPALAVVAACAKGTTRFTGAASLRGKESDRLAAMAHGLRELGIACQEGEDSLAVTGGRLRGGAVRSRGDHRVHMAFSIAGLAAAGPVTVDGLGCEAASYPAFHQDLARLSGVAA